MTIVANENRISYGIKRFLFDTIYELIDFDTSRLYPGSVAYVANIDEKFILNSQHRWVRKQKIRINIVNGGTASGLPIDDGEVNGGTAEYPI